MTRNEAVERVARVICAAEGHDPDEGWTAAHANPSLDITYPAWQSFTAEARAAIAECLAILGEPTSAMLEAMEDAQSHGLLGWQSALAASPLSQGGQE